MKDTANLENLKIMIRNIFAFVMVILIIVACGIIFGAQQYSLVSNHYDRPAMNFHDHRIY